MTENVANPQHGGASLEGSPSAEVTKLRQDLARAREDNQEALRHVELVNKIYQSVPGGKELIESIQRGETPDLSPKEAKEAAAFTGLTKEELQAELTQFEQRQRATRQAEREMDGYHERAAKELAGYDDLVKSDKWNKALNLTIAYMQEGVLEPPADVKDPMYWAIQHTYSGLTGLKPGEKGKNETPAEPSEAERRGAVASQQTSSAGPPEDNNELKNHPDYNWATARNKRTVGRSFADFDSYNPSGKR